MMGTQHHRDLRRNAGGAGLVPKRRRCLRKELLGVRGVRPCRPTSATYRTTNKRSKLRVAARHRSRRSRWNEEGRRLVMTAYDAVTALRIRSSDMILVGDSVSNVCLGCDNTLPVSIAMINHHLKAVECAKPLALPCRLAGRVGGTQVVRHRRAALRGEST